MELQVPQRDVARHLGLFMYCCTHMFNFPYSSFNPTTFTRNPLAHLATPFRGNHDTGLRMHSHFSTLEPPIGGKFPKETYDNIISEVQRILTSMSLMAHTMQNLDALSVESRHSGLGSDAPQMAQLAETALKSADFISH